MGQCHKCNLFIAMTELAIVCKGFCTEEHYFHAKCVGLSELEHQACYHSNFFWMCDSCRNLMLNSKFRNTVNGMRVAERNDGTEVEDLRTEVSKLNESVKHLMEKIHKVEPITPLSASTSQDSSGYCEQQLLSSTVLQKNCNNRPSPSEGNRFLEHALLKRQANPMQINLQSGTIDYGPGKLAQGESLNLHSKFLQSSNRPTLHSQKHPKVKLKTIEPRDI